MIDEFSQRNHLIDVARSWLNTPYHHAGRIKGVGVDCGTLLSEVSMETGLVERVVIEDYVHDWHHNRSEEKYLGYVQRYAYEIDVADIEIGDILVWKFGRCFSHGAIYIGEGRIIHALLNVGCTMDELNSEFFKDRECRAFSFWDAP